MVLESLGPPLKDILEEVFRYSRGGVLVVVVQYFSLSVYLANLAVGVGCDDRHAGRPSSLLHPSSCDGMYS